MQRGRPNAVSTRAHAHEKEFVMRASAFPFFSLAMLPLTFGWTTAAFAQPRDAESTVVSSIAGDLRAERLAALEFPWGMDALPDGRLLITEKLGRLRIFEDGRLSEPIGGVPQVVYRGIGDQGGLLDVAADPDFERNGLLYLSFVEAAEGHVESLRDTDDFRFPAVDTTDDIVRGGAVARAR